MTRVAQGRDSQTFSLFYPWNWFMKSRDPLPLIPDPTGAIFIVQSVPNSNSNMPYKAKFWDLTLVTLKKVATPCLRTTDLRITYLTSTIILILISIPVTSHFERFNVESVHIFAFALWHLVNIFDYWCISLSCNEVVVHVLVNLMFCQMLCWVFYLIGAKKYGKIEPRWNFINVSTNILSENFFVRKNFVEKNKWK